MHLYQRMNVYRGTPGAKRDFVSLGEVWKKVYSNVPTLFDPVYHYRSNVETLPEELVGREEGLLFVLPKPIIMVRDIIVITNDKSGVLKDRQYDVEFVNGASGFNGLHHLECTVFFRDNPVVLT